MSLPITFPSELSQALLTLDLVGLVLPLLLVVCYCCVINSLPIRSMDVLAMPYNLSSGIPRCFKSL